MKNFQGKKQLFLQAIMQETLYGVGSQWGPVSTVNMRAGGRMERGRGTGGTPSGGPRDTGVVGLCTSAPHLCSQSPLSAVNCKLQILLISP